MLNKVQLIGNVGRAPELRVTPQGTKVANFTLATNRRWKDREGKVQEQTEWHRLVVWGNGAQHAVEYVAVGRQLYVEGRLRTRSFEKEGQTHYSTEIVVERWQLLGSRPTGADTPAPAERELAAGSEPEDDDIPF